jgi:hypothetical protein
MYWHISQTSGSVCNHASRVIWNAEMTVVSPAWLFNSLPVVLLLRSCFARQAIALLMGGARIRRPVLTEGPSSSAEATPICSTWRFARAQCTVNHLGSLSCICPYSPVVSGSLPRLLCLEPCFGVPCRKAPFFERLFQSTPSEEYKSPCYSGCSETGLTSTKLVRSRCLWCACVRPDKYTYSQVNEGP